jgi:hypothetical protein
VRMSLYIDLCTLQFYVWVCCDSLSTPHILAFFLFIMLCSIYTAIPSFGTHCAAPFSG